MLLLLGCCLLSPFTHPTQIIKQVNKLIYVKDVSDITSVPYVARELMLVKVGLM
jgi:acetolactate synthase small subunit